MFLTFCYSGERNFLKQLINIVEVTELLNCSFITTCFDDPEQIPENQLF